MYKLLIFKLIKKLSYVTIILLFGTLSADDAKKEKLEQAKKMVQQLGANSFKQRKAAIKALISLGYYARSEVQKVLDSDDPEVKENAKTVWEKIRWAVTENNPELVNDFILKYNNGKATVNDWTELVKKCGTDSIDVMIELTELNKLTNEDQKREVVKDPFEQEGPFEMTDRHFGLGTMLPTILYNEDYKDVVEKINDFKGNKKLVLKSIFNATAFSSNSYVQSNIVNISSKIFGPEQAWTYYKNSDISSKYIRRKLPANLITYLKKNYKEDKQNILKSYMALELHKEITIDQIASEIQAEDFHLANDLSQKVFFDNIGSKLPADVQMKLLENGQKPWHKYRLLSFKKMPDAKDIRKTFTEVFNKGGDIVEFIQENFSLSNKKAIPFHLIASEIENKENNWFLYSTSTVLTNHFHRIGDFPMAIKFLKMFNDETERQQDTNEAFYVEQDRLIKDETKKLLIQVQPLQDASPKEALKLLKKAEVLNPDILIIKIQIIEALINLKKNKEAISKLQKTIKAVPENLLEIRDLMHLCWELDAKELAEELIKKISLNDENYSNITLASSSFEYFSNMEKTQQLQQKIGLNSFAQTRKFFYEKNYEPIPALCVKPDEGDFQYIWGVISVRMFKGKKEASHFLSKRIFDETWPELLGLSLCGKISPEEIIEEAKSVLNLTERRGRLTEAYYYAACSYLADGNKEKAKELFQKSLDLSFYEYYEYVSSKVMLKQL